jgi:hypothetical protein
MENIIGTWKKMKTYVHLKYCIWKMKKMLCKGYASDVMFSKPILVVIFNHTCSTLYLEHHLLSHHFRIRS